VNVPGWVWVATIGGLLVLLAIDLVIVDRKPHEVTIGEAARWVVFYVACATVFGLGIWLFSSGQYAAEFLTGYITEYSLSVDNLFVFVIIMSTFSVPAIHQHKVLLIGIVLALIMRGIFIALGSAVISRFSWVFYLFGLFLIYTAWKLVLRRDDDDAEFRENIMLRAVRRILPVTDDYRGAHSIVREHGRLLVTPMFIVMVAIGTTDLLFALDSIPAIFGLTKEPFLVFTANAFALMGLRQLYFLVGGLLDRLVYLSIGLAVILGFIGVKLILEAMHDNHMPFINGGQGLAVPTIGVGVSLLVIVVVLAATTAASLIKVRRDPHAARGRD
jgi:tellurite resistance protein TerC